MADMVEMIKDEASVSMGTCSFNTNEQKATFSTKLIFTDSTMLTSHHLTKHTADNVLIIEQKCLSVNHDILWC